MATNPSPPNPDDTLFWQEVRQAYDQVSTHNDRSVEIARSSRAVQVWYDEDEDSIFIQINQANTTTQEALITP